MIQIAFYKGKGNWFDWLVRWWTKSPYSHCELLLENTWYSSSPRDNGVRKKSITLDKNHWDLIKIDATKKQEEELLASIEKEIGKKYDWLGILLSQVFPLGIDTPNRWFCSEVCSYWLKPILHDTIKNHPSSYSPGSLYSACKRI